MSDDYREDERYADEREREADQYADEPYEGEAPLERRPRRRRRRPPPEESKKVAAGILAILLGGFGVHKFFLGITTPAVIMLCVTLFGYLTGCFLFLIPFLGPMVMGVIGLVEGIIYLTKTDQEFIETYQIDKKEWF